MKTERKQNGYYWVKPNRGYYKDKWVIATYEGTMFWVHGIGVAYTEDSLEINNNEIIRDATPKVAEMPTEVTDDEIAAMALEFAPVCIYGDDDDCEDVNGSIREDVTKLLKQLRNRMSKPNNCTGGEG